MKKDNFEVDFEKWLEDHYSQIDTDCNNSNEAWEGRRDTWFSELDGEDYIRLGNLFAKEQFLRGMDRVINKLK